jgi:hypothetical protein
MQKLLKYIILFGIFTLPIINSRITELQNYFFDLFEKNVIMKSIININ